MLLNSNPVATLPANPMGRDLIVGDVHGHFSLLEDALAGVGFDPDWDRLICVGDLVDRGPESHLALDWLRKPWFHSVLGNHEAMAVMWALGRITEASYVDDGGAWNARSTRADVFERARAFAGLPVAIELETPRGLVGVVHADCQFPSWQAFKDILASAGDEACRAAACTVLSRERARGVGTGRVNGVRAVVVGHTTFEAPCWKDNVLHIDTLALGQGRFTLIDAETLLPARGFGWTDHAACAADPTAQRASLA